MTRTIFETPAPFAKVTFCNSNPFTTEYAFEFLKQINNEINPGKNIFDNKLKFSYSEKTKLIGKVYSAALNIINSPWFPDQNKTFFGHSLSDILISCLFNGKTCIKNDFKWIFDQKLGNCYVFNDLMENQTVKQSYLAGLKLTVYSNFQFNLSYVNSVKGESGFKIRI